MILTQLERAQRAFAAEAAGRIAFKRGAKAIPCLDDNLNDLLLGVQVGEGKPILMAWVKGWGSENSEDGSSQP